MPFAALIDHPRSTALRALNYAGVGALSRPKRRDGDVRSLSSMLATFGDSYWAVFTRLDCAPELGVELLSQTDMFMAEPEGRVIRRDSMPKPDLHEVKRWQVLIAGAGQMGEGNLFGRSLIADARVAGKYLGPHAVSLTFEEPGGDLNLWTYAFLNTSFGMKAIRSCAFGTSVPGLRLDLLGEVPIPVPSDASLLSRVAQLIRTTVSERERYLRELRSAREVLENIPEMQDARAACVDRTSRAVLWSGSLRTLSAWNYSSTGEARALLDRKWSLRFKDALREDGLFYGGRSARLTCSSPHGVDFVSQRDAFLIRPITRRVALPGLPDSMIFAPEGAFLLAARGTLAEGELFGRPIMPAGALGRCGLTGDLLRVVPKDEYLTTAYAFLSTLVGRRMTRSTSVGTKILQLRFDLFGELPFPDVELDVHELIRARLTSATTAREAAERAEEEAVRIVESEVATKWLA